MSKDIDAGLITELAIKRGTEPLNIVSIQWVVDGDFIDYVEVEPTGLEQAKIISLSGIDAIQKVTSGGGAGSVSVVLDDKDGAIELILKTTDVHKRKALIYQTFQDYVPPGIESDRALIFSGEVSSPITYSETDRTVSFEIVTQIESEEVGFSPEEGEFDFIDESAVGKAWPLCFGSPVRVPAVRINESVRGTSLTRYGAITLGDLNDLCSKATTFANAESDKILQEANLAFNNDTDKERIVNYGGAKVALDTTLASLVFDSPTQEGSLISFANTCTDIQKNERNKTLFTALAIEAQGQIAILGPQVTSLQAQLAAAKAVNPPNADLVDSLEDQLELAEDGAAASAQAGTAEVRGLNDWILVQTSSTSQVLAANSNITSLEATKSSLENSLLQITLTALKVQGGEKFPQSTSVEVIINGAKFEGTFTGEDFAINNANLPVNTNISISPGPIANQFVIPDAAVNLKGQYCFLGDAILFVEAQQGTTCTFTPALFRKDSEFLFGPLGRDIFEFKTFTNAVIKETSALFFVHWLNTLNSQVNQITQDPGMPSSASIGSSAFSFANGLDELRSSDYSIEVGDTVYLASGYAEKYVANLIPSTEVKEVMAFRLLDGVRKLVPIPSRYYTINLSEAIAGQTSTTLVFPNPLEQFTDEKWEDDVYVTLISSVGPNTATIISYLLTTYTSLTPETVSFADVTSKLVKFPSHFAVLERRDALDLIDDIASQARCGTFLRNEDIVIRYLAESPTSVRTLSEANVDLESLEIGYTETEKLVTKFTAIWRRDYAKEKEDRGKTNKIVLRNNIPIYGTHEEEREFFIYNIEELVIRSLTFWLIRRSHTWYSITLRAFLDQLELEPYDGVTFAYTVADHPLMFDISGSGFRSQVRDIGYDSSEKEITFKIWRPIPAGRESEHPLAYPASAATGITYPTAFDPYTGGAATL